MSPIQDRRWAEARRGNQERAARDSEVAAQREYIKPGIVAAGCGGLVLALAISRGAASEFGIGPLLLVYAIITAVSVVVGFIALIIAAKLWLGGIDNLPLTAVRLVALSAAQDVISMVMPNMGLISLGLTALVIACLVTWLFEMEFQDAAMVTVIIVVINIVVSIAIFAAMMNH